MHASRRTGILLKQAVHVCLRSVQPCHRLHASRHIHTAGVVTQKVAFSRYPVPIVEQWPADLQEKHKANMEKSGFVPNVFSAWAYRPDELKAFLHFHDLVMEERGNLTMADKEMIIVATSTENKCLYCVVSRGALLRLHSKNPYLADQISVNWRTAEIDERQRAILDFAVTVCHAQPIPEEKFAALEKHGLSYDDAWDIGVLTALFALSNRMAFLMNLKPNMEFYSMGRDGPDCD